MKKTILISLAVSSLFCFAQNKPYNRFPDLENKIGTHFPIEIFKNEKGDNYNAEYLKGKSTFINFWSATCEPCLEELPSLNKLKKTLKGKVNFIAITYDNREKLNRFLSKNSFDFLHITDALPQLKSLLTIIRNPMTFIIDKNGNVKEIYGSVNENNIKLIEKSLEG